MKPMKNIVAATSLAMVFAALSSAPVLGQTQGAQQSAAAADAPPQARPVAAKRTRSKANADARHCLQLATNIEIHRCAHKYL